MVSVNTKRFRECYKALPKQVRLVAKKAYTLWKEDDTHPSLHFKQIHTEKPIYSVRVTLTYRALGVKKGDTMIWFWIGSHAEYDQLIASSRK
jgi:hypothetical protein